jgi:hypothetical protein
MEGSYQNLKITYFESTRIGCNLRRFKRHSEKIIVAKEVDY